MSDQVLVYLPTIAIKIGGAANSAIEADLEEAVVDLTFNLPAMATLRLHDPELKWCDDTSLDIGKALTISLGAPASFGGATGAVFDGEIVALEPEYSADGQHMLTVRAYDKSHRLHRGRKTRTFLTMSDSDLVSKIAKEAGLTAMADSTSAVHEYILQCNQSNMEFLSERARRIGYQLFVEEGELHFHKPGYKATGGPVLTLGDALRKFHVRASAARQVKTQETYGWDVKKKEAIVGSATAAILWHANGFSKTGGATADGAFGAATNAVFDAHVVDKAEADLLAAGAAADLEGNFITAEGVAYGEPKIKPAVEIELKGLGTRFSGKYVVSAATHIFRKDGYDVHFTVTGRYPQTMSNLVQPGPAQSAAMGQINGVVVGIVTNVHDAEGMLGRIKVKYPWLPKDSGKDIESHWVRIATPMAGAERGMLYVPEINDEVLIAFEQGDVNRPYMIGALWNGKDKPPEDSTKFQAGGKIVHHMIKSRLGHLVVLDDSDGEPSIKVIDKTGRNSIVISSKDNTITVLADKDLIIDVKGNIDMKAGGNITMKATGNIQGQGTNVELKANASGKFEASATLDLKGAILNAEAQATATLKGALVNVQGSGPVKVAGTPIMLN
jgi:uncharacterized protein involved in type VI secretion and phage assembly